MIEKRVELRLGDIVVIVWARKSETTNKIFIVVNTYHEDDMGKDVEPINNFELSHKF